MKNNIDINVEVVYLEQQSDVRNNQYAYGYTITIVNQGTIGAQLLSRHWYIQDETGYTEEVIGEGVVGQQPYLAPGKGFQYSSGAMIKTPTGIMKGTYDMLNDIGEHFEAEIPEFTLRKAYTLH